MYSAASQSRPTAGNVVIIKAEYGDLPDGPGLGVTLDRDKLRRYARQ